MINVTDGQNPEKKCPGKLLTDVCADPNRRAAAIIEILKRVILLAVLSFGLFGNVARAQFIGVTKPFDPASQQLAPIGETIVTGNGIEYNGGPASCWPAQCLLHLVWQFFGQRRSQYTSGSHPWIWRLAVLQYQHNLRGRYRRYSQHRYVGWRDF